jgi:hypothetical protein
VLVDHQLGAAEDVGIVSHVGVGESKDRRARIIKPIRSTENTPARGRVFTQAYLENQQNGRLATQIRFRERGIFDNQPVISTLFQLAELVGNAIEALDSVGR